MRFRKILWAAAVALSMSFALNVALPATASAKVVSLVWTCNSDGFEHVVITYDDGTTQEYITNACGPSIAAGGGFNVLFSDATRVSESGQAFLLAIETDGFSSPRRVPARDGEAPAPRGTIIGQPFVPGGGTPGEQQTIELRPEDVGPVLAAFLARIDPDWKTEPGTPASAQTIFDRWGTFVSGTVLVPGDMAMTIPFPTPEVGVRSDAKQGCLDKQGFWRRNAAGAWGCWTTAK